MDIKKLANRLVRQHNSRNPFEIIKGLNVILLFVPLDGVRGNSKCRKYLESDRILFISGQTKTAPYGTAFIDYYQVHNLIYSNLDT